MIQGNVLVGLGVCCAVAMGSASATKKSFPIKHVIIIMQENRSFDSYFGTFPGANGIPPGVCVPYYPTNPSAGCVVPFHDVHDQNAASSHTAPAAKADLDDGITTDNMDGFVYWQDLDVGGFCSGSSCSDLREGGINHDVMGYHTDEEIPNYWSYAENFVLQDAMFESVRSWSWPSHLYITSEWSADCTDKNVASTCTTTPMPAKVNNKTTVLPWVNLFQLLDNNGVSWKYYLGTGTEPDCDDDEMTCPPQVQTASVPSIWNPAGLFASVKAQGSDYLTAHDVDINQFLLDVQNGNLPQVSWLVPAAVYSEHPPNGVTEGMEYVTSMVNAVMQSPYWQNTAIFISWDDWGGFYDHVAPPNVDTNDTVDPIQGYGIRVPGLMISAYAKPGHIDHSVLSFDTYATFIEDIFANGARLDPTAMGNPDNRPDVRDALTSVTFLNGTTAPIGDLKNEFDFNQTPLPPLVLSTHIPAGIKAECRANAEQICGDTKVTISWYAVAAGAVPGPFTYHVQRNGVELPQCIGTAVTCTDSPGTGTWYYRAYSVDATNVASPLSAAAEADEP